MIRYDLICDHGHEFDGWFSDSAAFDKQQKRWLVECTHCGSSKIQKQLMAPGIPSKSNRKSDPAPTQMLAKPADPRAQAMVQMMRDFRAHVEKIPKTSATTSPKRPARSTTRKRKSAAFTAMPRLMKRKVCWKKASTWHRCQDCLKTETSFSGPCLRLLPPPCNSLRGHSTAATGWRADGMSLRSRSASWHLLLKSSPSILPA